MARIDNLYSEDDVPSSGSFEPIPAGEYRMRITETEKKDTKSGTGWYLKVVLEVTSGEYKGRKVFDRLNLVNSNAQAVEIARKIFAAMRNCFGVPKPKDSVELHGHEGMVRVKCVDGGEKYGIRNEVAAYLPRETADDRPRPPAEPSQTASNKIPW